MPPKTGFDLYVYYNTATHAIPTWSLISQVEDVAVDQLAWDTAELARRSSRILLELPTVMRVGARFKLWHGLSATVFDALRGKFFARTVTEFLLFNGPVATVGSEGLRMGCIIKEFPWDQPLREISSHDVRIVPTFFEESGAEVELDWHETV